MIRFTIDGADGGRGYELCAQGELRLSAGAIFSGRLSDERAIALQARQLADAAAALLESLPEYEEAFERLHDAIDALPTGEPA